MKFYVNNYTVCLLLLYYCYHFYEQEMHLESRIFFFLIEDCYHKKPISLCWIYEVIITTTWWIFFLFSVTCLYFFFWNFLAFHSLHDSTQRFRFTPLSFLPMSLLLLYLFNIFFQWFWWYSNGLWFIVSLNIIFGLYILYLRWQLILSFISLYLFSLFVITLYVICWPF